ncbi:MAG: 50S ribosomal protein L9 [Spirochaetes bacterium GWB1_48_6]|nr:MAG: 50S ribosomal protein L9 [Spirochaetes bacterium GWB1_48_6]
MKIILNKDVPNLGEEGDVKVVANGYARNFLIPQKIAVLFSAHAAHMFEQKKAQIEARKEAKKQIALSLKEKINAEEIEITMSAGDNGKLFGAVTPGNIADLLAAKGIVVEKKLISITGNAIKVVGVYEAKVKVMEKEYATLKVTVKATSK